MEAETKDLKDIKTGKELTQWIGQRFTEVTDGLAEAKDSGAKMTAQLENLKLLVNDANRSRTVDTAKTGRMPITKEAFVAYGMKAILDAPLPAERGADGKNWNGDGLIAKFHEKSDELLIMSKLLRMGDAEQRRATKYFRDEYLPAYRAVEAMVKDAFDIQTAGQGLEWVATDLSGSLIELVRLQRKVASLFEELPMPHGVLTVPTWLTDAQAYGFSENTSDSGGTAIVDGIPSAGLTTNFVITAKGIGLALTTSRFQEEDSVIPWLPLLRRAGVQALVNGEEDAIDNGDTTATHMDADIAAVTGHVDKQWKGLRYVGLLNANAAKTDCEGNAIGSDDALRSYVLKSLGNMGKYGAAPSGICLIVSAMVNSQLLGVPTFLNAYARGAGATNVNGIVSSPFGWDYTISEYLRTNLSLTGVNTSAASTVDKTTALLVHKDSWKKGRVRQVNVQLLDQTRALYDQDQLVFTMRQGFIAARKMDGTEPHVGCLYNIKAA